jgi:hypothetical protein
MIEPCKPTTGLLATLPLRDIRTRAAIAQVRLNRAARRGGGRSVGTGVLEGRAGKVVESS